MIFNPSLLGCIPDSELNFRFLVRLMLVSIKLGNQCLEKTALPQEQFFICKIFLQNIFYSETYNTSLNPSLLGGKLFRMSFPSRDGVKGWATKYKTPTIAYLGEMYWFNCFKITLLDNWFKALVSSIVKPLVSINL